MEVLIAAEGLTRRYNGRIAIEDVNITLRRGEVVGFLGPNGAGKTTTMRILSGVLAPHAGNVRIAGFDLFEQPRAAKARIGYLPEQPPLYRELRVDEYLRYCARLHGLPARGIRESVERVKRRCGLADSGERLIGNLSMGYQQRVGVAQAIIHAPAVVILDEPTVGLDPLQVREIRALMGELRDEHGVILSTHILPEVQTVCDRVLILHEGRVVLDAGLAALAAGRGRWRLRLRRPPSAEELRGVNGVEHVSMLEEGQFVVEGEGLEGDTLARHALDRGWGLLELAPHGRNLEEIFARLTCGETSPEIAA